MKKSWDNLKIAVYYDWLNQWGGAERVFLDLLNIFPQAQVFTLLHNRLQTPWLPKNYHPVTSFLQRFPQTKILTPFYDLAAEKFDFSGFDLIISTTTNVGHCLLTPPQSLFVCYYHNLNRYLYLNPPRSLKKILSLYQKIDKIYAKRPDYSFCNSQTVKKRLKKFLGIDAQIIYPGIDTSFFQPIPHPQNNYYLLVSRLVKHKHIDYAINTFKGLPFKLKIVGTGRDSDYFKKISPPNVEFLGQVTDHLLLSLYQNCRCLICPQVEDFGLASLEAQSCGRPVVGFNGGGNQETIIHQKTGVLHDRQDAPSLSRALKNLDSLRISSKYCRTHALKFDRHLFMLNFKKSLYSLWQQYQLRDTF